MKPVFIVLFFICFLLNIPAQDLGNSTPYFPEVKNSESFFYYRNELSPADIIQLYKEVKSGGSHYQGWSLPERNGLPEGLVVIMHDNAIRTEMEFKNGMAEGVSRVYDKKGNLVLETNYKQNKRNGLRKLYSNFRSYVYEARYEEDKLIGKIKVYEDRRQDFYYMFPGDLKKGTIEGYTWQGVKNGEIPVIDHNVIHGTVKYFTDGGRVWSIFPYRYGKLHGKVTYYKSKDEVWYSVDYNNGVPTGRHIAYYAPDKLKYEHFYDQEGKKTGVWKNYDRDGNVERLVDAYVNDSISGTEEGFFNGKLRFYSEYKNGKKHGIDKHYNSSTNKLAYISYYDNDQRIRTENYHNDFINTVTFFEEGKIRKSIFYDKNGAVVHEANYNEQGKGIGIIKGFSYDKEGNYKLTGEEEYNESGDRIRNKYYYGEEGNYTETGLRNGSLHGPKTTFIAHDRKHIVEYYFNNQKVTREEFESRAKAEKK